MTCVRICAFTGSAASLVGKSRTRENVLAALRKDPKLSVWDMGEYRWLRLRVEELVSAGEVSYSNRLQYPWVSFEVRAP